MFSINQIKAIKYRGSLLVINWPMLFNFKAILIYKGTEAINAFISSALEDRSVLVCYPFFLLFLRFSILR